jgi:hypothetical protein
MSESPIGRYRDADGNRHELVVGETDDGGWRVLDANTDTKTAHVVDTLPDDQDGRPQAEAIARDYLATIAGSETGAGPVPGDAIPEQGGPDARSHRRPHQATRVRRPRRAALPRPAR